MTRPEILSAPNIPKPLHGLNPRTIMGNARWDTMRQKVYSDAGYCCQACGVHKSEAKLHKWLEAHEVFEIGYQSGEADLVEIVALCHFCHSFIHSGLLGVRAGNRQVSATHVRSVLRHGVDILKRGNCKMFIGTAYLCDEYHVDRSGISVTSPPSKIADWGEWRMTWNGETYKGRFNSYSEWRRQYT